ncbi:hypothetical protein Calab_3089 [Caldithrix abyssi DSM 13497]|uniref:Type IX secretion system protein PorV domain-containing protein n=1 Tax=Caldithrix abyssi DSM 13497 TaxID=880073 RepID=H1XTS8_CALAY|nr:PorV/PorQ family protein [Caldithrix abyssi]APF18715.1 hypothetical protein Cabys_1966 [Caldithrix abyssi DSM 13497]EHO42695.1 hypothetical protein Calab_3089 [Caldithrix abyssi DSM 13497]
MEKRICTIFLFVFLSFTLSFGQKPYRVGTTAANFLEIGYGSAGSAMGDACVSSVSDVSAVYWNPAALAFLQKNEAQFVFQPWIADISTAFVATSVNIANIGTLGFHLIHAGYGNIEVTNLNAQEGTGEFYSADEYAFGITYARQLTNWFSFGATGKFIASKIWHVSASALALDLGVVVQTPFFSTTGQRKDGLRVAMSIANYGSRMRYDGLDLVYPIDPLPDENGNYADVPGQYRLSYWELPLIFRIGASLDVVKAEHHTLTLEVDALHPNNNSESVNIGGQYAFKIPTTGVFFLRGGFKGLFMDESQYGLTLGLGMIKYLMNNISLKVDYAFRDVGILGNVHSYSIGIVF